MIQAIYAVLATSALAALVLAAVCRAARPGGLLVFLAGWWEWWLVYRPVWLPVKPSGDCLLCTCFWLPGIPVAVLAGLYTPAGPWAVAVPFCVAVLSEILLLL